jgi:hypothetical protein
MGVLGAGQAQAYVVTVSGQQWNVTTFIGKYNDFSSRLQSQVWWGDQAKATAFANAVAGALVTPGNPPPGTQPAFGFCFTSTGFGNPQLPQLPCPVGGTVQNPRVSAAI